MFIGLSVVGYAGLAWILLALVLSFATRRNVTFSLLVVASTVWIADLVAVAVKTGVERPRPDTAVPQADPLLGAGGWSFPSGHATTAFAGAVALTYLWRRGAPLFFLLAVAIAFSRVYVGVHYPADVLAGAALGTAVAVCWLGALRPLRRSAEARRRSGGGPPAG